MQVVTALDRSVEHRCFKPSPWIILGMLAHCPPKQHICVPDGNTGEVKGAKKGAGHPTSVCRWRRVSVLSNRHFPTFGMVYGTSS